MKFLYVAPRYHTNQVPIVRGLIKSGHEVKFISHFAGNVEDYSEVTPIVLGYSIVFEGIYKIVKALHLLNDAKLNSFRMKCGFPKRLRLKREILEFSPNVVITRERSMYSIAVNSICKKNDIDVILYDQSPLWLDEIKNDIPHRLVRKLTPNRRMTPVYGKECKDDGSKRVMEPNSMYIPFIMEPKIITSFDIKEHACGENHKETVRLLEIGKYEERKNHIMMLDVFEKLADTYDIELVIVGECTTDAHKQYYARLEDMVKDIVNRKPWLSEKIILLKNLKHNEMDMQYRNADIFVLPSTKEPASISQLEAMAYALPVICSDKNGTSCVVEDRANGFLFKDNDETSLYEKLETMLNNTALRETMAEKSYELINEKYQIDQYLKKIAELQRL